MDLTTASVAAATGSPANAERFRVVERGQLSAGASALAGDLDVMLVVGFGLGVLSVVLRRRKVLGVTATRGAIQRAAVSSLTQS
jgi:hypothetical protein